jgi:hypothetical protein
MSGGIIIKFGIVVVWREISSSNASGPSHIYTQSYHKFGGGTLLAENERMRGKRGRSYHRTIKYLSPGVDCLLISIINCCIPCGMAPFKDLVCKSVTQSKINSCLPYLLLFMSSRSHKRIQYTR